MNRLPAKFGNLLGLGVLLAWQGFRVVKDREQPEDARRHGMWKLCGAIALVAASMIGITWVMPKF